MDKDSNVKQKTGKLAHPKKGLNHGRIVSVPNIGECLDTDQLSEMEQSFREWAEASARKDVRLSRKRILLIFLLIRYTGAKLNEVLALDPFNDIDHDRHALLFKTADDDNEGEPRQVWLSEVLTEELRTILADVGFQNSQSTLLKVDPAFVRRKFYERAHACGFDKQIGGPEMIRKARGVELMRSNLPLPAVQRMLGHATPNLTTALVSFSDEEIQKITKLHMEREASRKTSARNSFYGKIAEIRRGQIQAWIRLTTIGGHEVVTVITKDSLDRLGLEEGKLVTAEIKAPWITLHKGEKVPLSSAENRFHGTIILINNDNINSECVVQLSDGTELCAIISSESAQSLKLRKNDKIWMLFNCFSAVLNAE